MKPLEIALNPFLTKVATSGYLKTSSCVCGAGTPLTVATPDLLMPPGSWNTGKEEEPGKRPEELKYDRGDWRLKLGKKLLVKVGVGTLATDELKGDRNEGRENDGSDGIEGKNEGRSAVEICLFFLLRETFSARAGWPVAEPKILQSQAGLCEVEPKYVPEGWGSSAPIPCLV